MTNSDETFEEMLRGANGNLDDAMADFANSTQPSAMPFMISIGADKPEFDPKLDKKEQWEVFVKAYKDDYLLHLRNGFDSMLKMLGEMASDPGMNPDQFA